RACDRCHRNACRCSPGIVGTTCGRCEKQAVECTYNRPVKRRAPPSEPSEPPRSPGINDEAMYNGPSTSDLYSAHESLVSPEAIESIMQVFYHNIYPMLPYFHWPTFHYQVRQQLYRSDRDVFVVVMSVCALTSGQLQNGIRIPQDLYDIRVNAATVSSKCYCAAVEAMPNDITSASDYLQAMKASAILAAVCLQNEDMKKTVAHLGDYLSLSVMHGFYAEANWPDDLTEIEKQERRRLFWGVYQQEQYISTNFGLPSRQCEAKTTVLYPAEVFDDEDIFATSIQLRPDRVSFLRGWNYCTDLYRLFENMNGMMRAWQQASVEEPRGLLNSFLTGVRPSKNLTYEILNLISRLYEELPPELKVVKDITGDPQKDWYGLIAMNIVLTTNKIKMLLAGTEKPNVHLRCAIASELLDEIEALPRGLSSALSIGSLHHLSHIGHILSSTIPTPLSTRTYLLVRNILVVLVELLENVELSRLSIPKASIRLWGQVDQIDQYMQQNPKQDPSSGLLTSQILPDTSAIGSINCSSAAESLNSAQESNFTISQQSTMQNSGSDFISAPILSTSHSTDLFKDWPVLPGETDALNSVATLLSAGSGTCGP
ncbi:hypothetical protein C8Q69DRAFT_403943, partial [Paecilomyces variotii]